ncbi:hypothetical protein CSHISOI_07521 [Colletotrichum shisoi]|uniref:Uncharacterized protein n=1 Tax=Colletotrichum shisoi TaxID=2078593 RepID=A0A5Q4BN27_9PEZI|nr:hypothetical protein CSHISOI_07521 [Colletotrichum shisoi]
MKFSVTQPTQLNSPSSPTPYLSGYPSRPDHSSSNRRRMEQFGVAAAHSGAINHVHAIHFGPAAVDVVREVRLAVTVVVIGWVAVTGIRTYFDRGRR